MKILIYAIVLMTAIIGFVLWAGAFIDNEIEPISLGVEKISAAVSENNWQEAYTLIEEVNVRWERVLYPFNFLMRHSEMDAITIQLHKLERFIILESAANAHGELESLKKMLEDLPLQDDLTWESLL